VERNRKNTTAARGGETKGREARRRGKYEREKGEREREKTLYSHIETTNRTQKADGRKFDSFSFPILSRSPSFLKPLKTEHPKKEESKQAAAATTNKRKGSFSSRFAFAVAISDCWCHVFLRFFSRLPRTLHWLRVITWLAGSLF